MILNENINEFFNNNEMKNIKRMQSSQDHYNNMNDTIVNPYNPNLSQILDFSIKNDDGTKDTCTVSGILDLTNSQFVIKKLEVKEQENALELVKNLLNAIIVNMETQYPDISIVYWRINKDYITCIKAAADKGFVIQDENQFSVEMVYYLASTPIRQNHNTVQVMKIVKNREMY